MYNLYINNNFFMEFNSFREIYDDKHKRTNLQFVKKDMLGKIDKKIFTPYAGNRLSIQELTIKDENNNEIKNIKQTEQKLIIFDNIGINITGELVIGFYYND